MDTVTNFASPSGASTPLTSSIGVMTKRKWKDIADKTGWITDKFVTGGCVLIDDEGSVQKLSDDFGLQLHNVLMSD